MAPVSPVCRKRFSLLKAKQRCSPRSSVAGIRSIRSGLARTVEHVVHDRLPVDGQRDGLAQIDVVFSDKDMRATEASARRQHRNRLAGVAFERRLQTRIERTIDVNQRLLGATGTKQIQLRTRRRLRWRVNQLITQVFVAELEPHRKRRTFTGPTLHRHRPTV